MRTQSATRISPWKRPALALSFALACATCSAQQEQWLDYHTSSDGQGYRYLELTTNAPAGVALPKLSGQPYYAHWTTPMDPEGRWLCFESTRKSGPYDRVYVDSNGKRKLDDARPITANRLDEYSAYFDPLRLVFKGPDGPITYHLVLRFMKYESSEARLLISSGGYYSGMVDIGGKKRQVELIDANVNGAFNDQDYRSGSLDRITISGQSDDTRYLGQMIEVDRQFYRIEVAKDGASLKIQKAENVALGKVQLPEALSEFAAVGEPGHFFRKPVKGELTLPAGKYRVNNWTINRKDSKGSSWTLSGYSFNEAADFEVTADKTLPLQVGEPMRASLRATESTNEVSFELAFLGSFGETLQVLQGNERPRGPRLMLASQDGVYHYTNTFEFG